MTRDLTYLPICTACVRGEGEECHTPECALFLRDVPPDGLVAEYALDIDALAAERIAALAEDEAALNAVWDAMESHGHNGIECRPEKPMDYTAVYVIHALAAVLTERRPSDG